MYHAGTYTNQWQVIDLSRFSPGEAHQPKGLLTVLEEIPGLVHWQDMTAYLNRHHYWPSYNVPYFNDIRALNGDTNGSWTTAPRAKLFKKFEPEVNTIESFQHLLRWNDYQAPLGTQCTQPLSQIMLLCGRLNQPSRAAIRALRLHAVPTCALLGVVPWLLLAPSTPK